MAEDHAPAAEADRPRARRKTAARDVFAVDRLAFRFACDRGLAAAVAYLVIARGTLGDQRTSRWSVAAIERHTGIGRPRARAALKALLAPPALIEMTKTTDKRQAAPRYRLLPATPLADYDPDLIWLPNRIVAGTKLLPLREGEIAPVELIRRCQDVELLWLFIHLYGEQDLLGAGGIEWRPDDGLWASFNRERVGESGQFTVVGFRPGRHWAEASPTFMQRAGLGKAFWPAFTQLRDMGLVERVDHLVEAASDEGEIVFPMAAPDSGRPEERALRVSTERAARDLLNDTKRDAADDQGLILVPLPHQFAEINKLIGVWRLRYLPWTQPTVDWIAGLENICRGYTDVFRRVQHQ